MDIVYSCCCNAACVEFIIAIEFSSAVSQIIMKKEK